MAWPLWSLLHSPLPVTVLHRGGPLLPPQGLCTWDRIGLRGMREMLGCTGKECHLLGRVTSHLTIHSFTKEMPACFESLKAISFASFFFFLWDRVFWYSPGGCPPPTGLQSYSAMCSSSDGLWYLPSKAGPGYQTVPCEQSPSFKKKTCRPIPSRLITLTNADYYLSVTVRDTLSTGSVMWVTSVL